MLIAAIRNFGVEAAVDIARRHAEDRHPYIVGFNLAGDEAGYPPAQFRRPTRSPPPRGLGCTVHAGEHAGAESVREALTLPVSRISHGVRAVEDPALVEEIAERGIVLEVCPTSNVATFVYDGYEDHPLRKLHEAGVNLTLGSDDPPYFGCSIGGEYAVARERFGFEEGELRASRVRRSGRPSRTMRPKAPCSIELLPQTTAPANRVAARRSNRKGVPAVRRPLHFIALLAMVCSLFVAACGSDDDDSRPRSGTSTAESTPAAKKIKVGLVTDIGGLNDRSFNQLANEGLERAKSELGVETRVLVSKADSDYVPNLSTLAQQKYDLVIGVGFLMAEAMNTVATKFPDTKFAVIDVDATGLKDKPTNVAGLLFKEQEAGYLVGYMAGLYLKDNGGGTASSVGGQKIPPVDHYIAGYQKGVKDANPDAKVVNGYSQKFDDPAPCKELALNQIAAGREGRLPGRRWLRPRRAGRGQGEGRAGHRRRRRPGLPGRPDHDLGAQEGRRRGLRHGQGRAGRHVQGRRNTIFDVKSGGVGIGKTNAEGAKYAAQVKEVQDKIASGEITDIPDTVK